MNFTEIRERWNGGLTAVTPIANALIEQARYDTGDLFAEIDRLHTLVRMGNDHAASTFAPLSAIGGVYDVPEMLATFDRAMGIERYESNVRKWDFQPAEVDVGIPYETWIHEDCPKPSPRGTTPGAVTKDEDGDAIVRCPDCGAWLRLGETL